jgi:cytochrome c-type biogenesis protein CcmH
MITFFIVAGLLLAGALFFVVPPLLGKRGKLADVSHDETNLTIYRDQLKELDQDLANGTIERLQYDAAKREIERRVIEEVEQAAERAAVSGGPKWSLAIGLAVVIPLAAVPAYLLLGTPAALDPAKIAAQESGVGHELTPERIAAMIDQLKAKLASQPDDAEGWMMLAKTSAALGRYEDSANAYRQAARLVPDDALLLADFADTLAMAQRSLDGEPQRLVEQALKIDPKQVKALALAGTIAFRKQDYAKAAGYWKRILDVVPPDSEFAERIRASVSEAEGKAGVKSSIATGASSRTSETAGGGVAAAKLSGRVDLAAGAKKLVSPEDTVFIFARAADGPKMPLAILRVQVKDLPKAFELTEAMAMAPGMSISKFPELVVGARVSKSGNAVAQPGDWESELVPARAGASGLKLVIARQVG